MKIAMINLKKSVVFFLVVFCCVSVLGCKKNQTPQADQDSIVRAEQREREFMQKRAEYIKKHGHVSPSAMQRGSVLIQK